MSGYPHNPSGYGAPAQPYGAPQPLAVYGAPPQTKPQKDYHKPSSSPYGIPQRDEYYGSVPVTFPPGTETNAMSCFYTIDKDSDGIIDDKELQKALLSYNDQSFSIPTVRLLMYVFTKTNTRKIGPKDFPQVFRTLQSWRGTFVKFDIDDSRMIDANALRDALTSLGFVVSPVVLDLLMSKFDKTGGKNKTIEYDNFVVCCLIVKGLTEKFMENETSYYGQVTFSYEAFMLTILPVLIA
ncbi:putative serine/threonine-protein phosphatase with EF-hands [Helianthus annuus]|uniref:Putative calcium binding protein 2 n=1 Tax=Helianthus annuus TaxID=4232 RepID=A0A251SQ71_HELAN|nr:calcium-binding protein CBP [Helianthus annuus]KAF5772098.1 putative serine/threonine-protein phosphatase with EF-hands [Helianthus annuus]KAJ0496564.1 putative calcium-binding protein CML48/49/50 [Helianthus annuus]